MAREVRVKSIGVSYRDKAMWQVWLWIRSVGTKLKAGFCSLLPTGVSAGMG